jgi:3-oxoacyl-[acyl-carrier protein] reductase
VPDKDLHGKIALVTGGSRGIGAACSRRLAAEGADVAISYVKSSAEATAVVDELTALGVRAAAFQADQARREEVVRMVGEVAAHFGRIDILVNSAGVFYPGPMGSVSPEDVAYQWAVNVQGVVTTTEESVAHMPNGGRIINIGSVAGERACMAGVGHYSATKAAVSMYGRSWAHELAPRNITVNTILAGFIQTDMVIPADSETGQMILSTLAFHRYASPEEVAAPVAFLASPAASYMTGGDIRVDGGWDA